MKIIWTVSWLIAWTRTVPAGIKTALVVDPGGDTIRLIMGDGVGRVAYRLPPCWRPWRYVVRLDVAVRPWAEGGDRVCHRLDAAHDAFCRGLDAREEGRRS